MSTIRLGRKSGKLDVTLTPNAAYLAEIDSEDETGALTPWPAGTAVELRFGAADLGYSDVYDDAYGVNDVWPAVTDGATVRWAVPADEVSLLIAKTPTHAQLWETSNGLPQRWANTEPAGSVEIETP